MHAVVTPDCGGKTLDHALCSVHAVELIKKHEGGDDIELCLNYDGRIKRYLFVIIKFVIVISDC